MPFIGIISDQNNESFIRKNIIKKLKLNENSVLSIKERNIDNIKNIKFETIIIARKFKFTSTLKKILENVTYLIINSDIQDNLKLLENIKAIVISYGFNSKATLTASSVQEDEILLCLQRTIQNKNKKEIEQQELKYPIIEDINCTMAVAGVLLVYKNNLK